MQELYDLLSDIGSWPKIHITQLDNLKFKIEIGGELMTSYSILGDIQQEIVDKIGREFSLTTIYGDGQYAFFQFHIK